jgi:hypothetical protein
VTIRIDFNGKAVGKTYSARVKRYSDQMIVATQVAARRVAENIEREGRANIRAGGNFESTRWQAGFRALVSFASRVRINIRVTHRVRYWRVFEFGAVIRGKPMLWIPLSFAHDAVGKRARDFSGKLFRVNRKGKAPLLMTNQGGRGVAKYFGKTSVRIPRKWRLREIIRREQRRLGLYYREAMRRGR